MQAVANRRSGPPEQAVTETPEKVIVQQPQQQGKKNEEALPLPGWLMKVYYIFPIILYVPDVIFNFYVYSDGSGLNMSDPLVYLNPMFYLWAFLATGIVGMAWLLSVLAPWHWVRNNRFQSIACWFGVILATSVTIWNSLAFRSLKFKNFATDQWIAHALGQDPKTFSVTMIMVAVAPPFWGLFWAIVQPSVGKRTAEEEAEGHAQKLERLKQESEYKKIKAQANAEIRAAQLKGLAATIGAAREQITTNIAKNGEQDDGSEADSDRIVPIQGGSVRRLSERRMGWNGEETTDSGEHDIVRGMAGSMSYSVAAQPRDMVFEAPSGEYQVRQGMMPMDRTTPNTGENETLLSTSRPGMPRASTLLRNYADGEHVMRTVDADVERMRASGQKITIKSFAESRGIDLSLSKQLLAKWREWKQQQAAQSAGEFAE